MKHTRIVVSHYGGPEEIGVVEEECPEPKQGEVRVRVRRPASPCRTVTMREGIHPETPRLPFTPGWDLVGVVDRVGEGVSGSSLVRSSPLCRSTARTRSSFACLDARWFRSHRAWTPARPSA